MDERFVNLKLISSGVRYFNSRVPSTARRNSSNRTANNWDYPRRSFVSYIRTTSPTPSPSLVPPSPPPHTTSRPPPTFTVPTTTRMWYSPPSFLETESVPKPRPTHMPIHYVQEFQSSEISGSSSHPKKWGHRRPHHDPWNAPRPWPIKKAHEFAGTSEYRGIAEGSYFDRSNSTAPSNLRTKFFDWESDKFHKHRHGHGSSVPTTRPPTATVVPNLRERYRRPYEYHPVKGRNYYQEFESRGVTYRPTKKVPARSSTVSSRRHSGVRGKKPATVDGSFRYYERERERNPSTIRRIDDNVSYVAGSYYPMSKGKHDRSRSRREIEETDVHPFTSVSGK